MMLICIGLRPEVVCKLAGLEYSLKKLSNVSEMSHDDACFGVGERAVIIDTNHVPDALNSPEVIRKLGFPGPILGISNKSRDSMAYDDIEPEVTFMRNGGDRLLRAPFTGRLIRAVVEALLRRTNHTAASVTEARAETKPLTFGAGRYQMNEETWNFRVDGKPVYLTHGEFAILWAMASRPGVVFSRDQLAQVLDMGQNFNERTVDSHVKRLRNKIKLVDEECDPIETLYGVGYRLKA